MMFIGILITQLIEYFRMKNSDLVSLLLAKCL